MRISLRYPALRNCPLLDDMPTQDKAAFLDGCILGCHARATELLTQGELAPGFYIIASGTVEISYISPEGHRAIITHLGAGDALGEAEVIGDMPCAATAVVHANSVTLLCPNASVHKLMMSRIFVRNVSRTYVNRMRRDNQFKSVDQFQPVEQRIGSYLWHLSTTDPVVRISQAYLANVVGCSRQTVNRVLGRLRDAGMILIRKEEIEICDPEALASLPDRLG